MNVPSSIWIMRSMARSLCGCFCELSCWARAEDRARKRTANEDANTLTDSPFLYGNMTLFAQASFSQVSQPYNPRAGVGRRPRIGRDDRLGEPFTNIVYILKIRERQ